MGIFRAVAPAIAIALWASWAKESRAAPDTGKEERALMARVQGLARTTANLRGFVLAGEVAAELVAPEHVRQKMDKAAQLSGATRRLEQRAAVFRFLGMLPQEFELVSFRNSLASAANRGFYDAERRKLVVATTDTESHLVHELCHALNLATASPSYLQDAGDSDARLARQALMEGDGVATMLEYQFANAGEAPPWGSSRVVARLVDALADEASDNALRDALYFPYRAGLLFVAAVRKHKSWKAVDALYAKPPLSTEHILHPDSYAAYELPIRVDSALPSALVGFSEDISMVMGEYGVRSFLSAHGLASDRVDEAASGWGGDRFSLYVSGTASEHRIGVWFTAWDGESDAREFALALEHALASLSGDAGRRVRKLQRYSGPGGTMVAERRGREVVLVLGANQMGGDAIRDEVWRRWSRGPVPSPLPATAPQPVSNSSATR